MANEFRIDTQCPGFQRMSDGWALVDALLGGSPAMRKAREKYLPKETDEETPQYEIRLKRAHLFPGVKDALRRVVGRPFTKPVTVQGALPKTMAKVAVDVDRAGTSIHAFARAAFRAGARYGLTHVLVDAPQFDGVATDEEIDVLNLRPYLAAISARDLFYWRFDRATDGVRRLAEIRYTFQDEEADVGGAVRTVKRIRRLLRDAVETWVQRDEKWTLESSGPNRVGRILLRTAVFCPGDGDDPFSAELPFGDLADVNLEHWQCSADQSALMRVARFPLLFFWEKNGNSPDTLGKPEKAKATQVVVGPNRLTRSHAEQADFRFVEHNGAAVGAGVKELERLEERMVMLGLRPLVERTGDQTATGQAIDEARDSTDVLAWIGSVERMLEESFADAAELASEQLPPKFSVDVFSDFKAASGADAKVGKLIEMRRAREITRETFLTEIKRLGYLSDSVDAAAEALKAEHEEEPLPPPFRPGPPAAPAAAG